MNQTTPFTLRRFEYEDRNLYYLPHDVLERLEQPLPVYLIGTRGTGKTTLLRSLNWEERLNNSSLRRALGAYPFSRSYIGLYIRVPLTQLDLIDQWIDQDHPSAAIMTSFYLDVLWLELGARAIGEMASIEDSPPFIMEPDHEFRLVSEIVSQHKELLQRPYFGHAGLRVATLIDLSRAFQRLREYMEIAARNAVPFNELLSDVPIGQVGQLGRDIGTQLCRAITESSSEAKWHFKICFDESECLSDYQKLVVNTWCRLTRWPLFPVVSYVSRPTDITSTLARNLTLSGADRHVEELDHMQWSDFLDLAKGVASVRVQEYTQDPSVNFNPECTLGRVEINDLLYHRLTRSEKPDAKAWLEAADELSKHDFFKHPEGQGGTRISTPPLYQTYLVKRLGIELPSAGSPRWQHRHQESAELRKRNVSAYLNMLSELDLDPLYAGADVVLQMTDRCIRDYVWMINEIYITYDRDLMQFLQERVPLGDQDKGVCRASEQKFNRIPIAGVRSTVETERVTDALASITHKLQTSGRDGQHIRSSERGIFAVSVPRSEEERYDEMLKLLQDADVAGFLRIIQDEGPERKFRVHTSLAAAYKFSYRGAYYTVRIPLKDLDRIRCTEDEKDRKELIAKLGDQLAGMSTPEAPLFEEGTDDE